jgi:hypothetical protein
MTTTKEQVGAVLASGGTQTIGALVFWSLASVRVKRDEFRERLTSLGLDSAMGKDPSPRSALSKAVAAAFTGRKGVMARRLANGNVGIVLERITAGHAKYRHVATVSAHSGAFQTDAEVEPLPATSSGPVVSYEGETEGVPAREALTAVAPSLLAELGAAYETANSYLLTNDLSEVLISAVNGSPHRGLLAGLSLRERTGGLYFIAGPYVERMQQLQHLIQDVAPSCVVSVMTITGSKENLGEAARAAKLTFAAQLDELKTELVDFKAGLQMKGKGASEYSIETRIERYKDLAARVAVFKDLLGVDDLERQIEAAKTEMVKELEGL